MLGKDADYYSLGRVLCLSLSGVVYNTCLFCQLNLSQLFIMKIFKICVLICLGILSSAQDHRRLIGNPCISRVTCGDCIAAHPECAWCSDEDFTNDGSRCDFIRNLFGRCENRQIISPDLSIMKLKDQNLGERGEVTQIRPQEINLKLRPNSPFPLAVAFRQTQDNPIDLYYLVDLSYSMKDDKYKLAELGKLLGEGIANITQNFRIGFGSFVGNVPTLLEGLCTECVAPYGFRNHMSLSMNTNPFVRLVRDAKISGNRDSSEGLFEAIMQAVVCTEQIGWRRNSKKILIFATNSGFRYTEDEMLGGIENSNDGFCHLNHYGYYTKSRQQDYPSLSQIHRKIQENKVNVIFAVTANQVPEYERLSNLLMGSSVGRLENDSSNVVDLIRSEYDKITSSVEMRDSAENNIKVTFYSTCLGDKKEKTKICKEIKVGTNVTFEAEIEVTSCPKNPSQWQQTFQIYPVGMLQALTVHLEIICECDCEKPRNEETYSRKCTGNGSYKCGVCSCYGNRFGRRCECDASDYYSMSDANCYIGNEAYPCSGRGSCICGTCDCFRRENRQEKVTGDFCECDNFSCDRSGGKICGGSDHGICDCGTCRCLEGWNGPECNCSDSIQQCISPENGKICSGHGDCECNVCKCYDLGERRYSGPYCENCVTCPLQCDEFRDCVECQIFPDDCNIPLSKCVACTFIAIGVDKVEVKNDSERLCVFQDDRGRQIIFKYKLDDDDLPIVYVQTSKERR